MMSYEIRHTKGRIRKGGIDEIVAREVKHFHLEQMDSGHWSIVLDLSDGKMLINLHSKAGIVVTAEVEDE